ncbi:MAG: hypothetical protein JW795_00425, partial [Chitinivibrionales bacterium]|nr:hypothetical protein [Chitinivibrionales bacterium]
MKLTIGTKIIVGYVPFILLIFVMAFFTLKRLKEVNNINNEIISIDLTVSRQAERIVDILLAQEMYVQRYILLKSKEMLTLFWKREQEFKDEYGKISTGSISVLFPSWNAVGNTHEDYLHYFHATVDSVGSMGEVKGKTRQMAFAIADSLRRDALQAE